MTEKIIIGFISLVLGIIIKNIWDKLKNRIAILNYTIDFLYLGATEEDPLFGSVKILYNNSPAENLYMATFTLENNSNRDLSDFELNIVSYDNTLMIVSHGYNINSTKNLLFTDNYSQMLRDGQSEHLSYLTTHRDYHIPIFNRGDKILINILTTNLNRVKPNISASIEVPGVRMKYAKPVQKIFGEPLQISSLLGILIAVLLTIITANYINNLTVVLAVTLFLGLAASLLGVIARKILRLFIKILF